MQEQAEQLESLLVFKFLYASIRYKSCMDIKSVLRSSWPFNVQATPKVDKRALTTETTDRDANGQSQQQEQKPKRNLSPEELQEAVAYLEALEGVKNNNLKVRLATADGISVVYIEDQNGKVVRRIPEAELSTLTKNRQQKSGHLLNKAM